MKRPKVAVIGYGFAGRCFHSYLVGLTPGLELKGIASRSPETRAKIVAERHCQAYESFEAVLADPEIDLVVQATPNASHCELAIRALEAGKHVVTDKVMCLNLAECDRMIAAARRTGRFLGVFQNRRWDGDFLTLQQARADGLLGDLRWVEMAWQGYGAWGGWRGQRAAGGGRLYDLGAHLVDQLVMLFPQAIESVYCRLQYDWPQTDTESHSLLVIQFAGGVTGICDTGCMNGRPKPRFLAQGTKATFEKFGLDPQERAMINGNIDAALEDPKNYARISNGKEEQILPTLPGRWRNFYDNIAAVLSDGAEPLVKLAEVRRAIAVFDAAFASAREGRVVPVDAPALKE